ncbi:hypothetical protein [Acanthopleuribacter pedis]|uniref:Uncharacterized protein n=1 Tax=Acanthopleuribacter pedis TaxID=442870 RepID=A0A8J7QJC1_9BACT|nr:hypothetical protein [Acanthopleuribacter pedis]MBO1319255.1 hypothetical protein [Acanthopleuribacter pedis]
MTNIDSVDAPAPAKEEKVEPKLISIDFLDGDDDTDVPQDRKQWVNLPRDAKWVDGTNIPNIDRLTEKPRVKVRFDEKGSHPFKVKYDPGGSNLIYTGGEQGRNPLFKYEETQKNYTTDGDGTKIIPTDWFINVCGMNVWRLEAEDDKGNKAQSHNLIGWRMIYLVEAVMTGVTANAAASLATLTGEYAKHGIHIDVLPRVNMTHMENIGANDSGTFISNTRTAYNGSQGPGKEPYTVVVGYTDHLAVRDDADQFVEPGVAAGPGTAKFTVQITDGSGNDKFLWNNIVTGEDWYVSCTFLPDPPPPPPAPVAPHSGITGFLLGLIGMNNPPPAPPAPPAPVAVNIPKADCVGKPKWAVLPDALNAVEIDLSGLPAATGTLTLTVNTVNRMRAGLSFGGGNLICVCTKAWWQVSSEADQNQVMIHELGHKIYMVVDGSGKQPDAVATQYDGKGHVGSHCYFPLGVLPSYGGVGGSGCVMFGATNGVSAFCVNCDPAVKKMDISDGWARL